MPSQREQRLETELNLLRAIYPELIQYDCHAAEVKYESGSSSFTLRLPPSYLEDELPVVLSASIGKFDAREPLRQKAKALNPGEEVLDSIVAAFNDLAQDRLRGIEADSSSLRPDPSEVRPRNATVIVWLHHLLNTNKRKQALSPSSPAVCGVTKPGYPGVLVYSGPSEAVHEHVNELKALNWQAFQIRSETDEEWQFAHGAGVKEVESMKDIVAEVGEANKEAFMEAMRMR
jgi:hypothetical protein